VGVYKIGWIIAAEGNVVSRVLVGASIGAVLAAAGLSALYASVVAVAVLLLAVGLGALASLPLRPLGRHVLPQSLKSLRVHLQVRAVGALAILAAEEPVAEAVAVELEALGLLAVALELPAGVGAGRRSVDGDEGVVLEDVLEAAVPAQLDGVELPQLDLAPLPLPEKTAQHVLPPLRLAPQHHHLPLLADLVGHALGLRWQRELANLHKILHTAKYNITTYRNNIYPLHAALLFRTIGHWINRWAEFG
jgi:hypothetical protein